MMYPYIFVNAINFGAPIWCAMGAYRWADYGLGWACPSQAPQAQKALGVDKLGGGGTKKPEGGLSSPGAAPDPHDQ